MRWLMGTVTGIVAVLLCAAVAQAQTPPTRTFGSVTIDGQPAPAGTKVEALILDKVCGENVVRRLNDEIPVGFVVDVASAAQSPGCGSDGDRIAFRVGGVTVDQTAEFQTGNFVRIDLAAAGQASTPTPGPTPPPFGGASPTPAGTAATTPPAQATAAPGSPTATATSATPTPEAAGTAAPAGTGTATPTAGGTSGTPTATTPAGTATGPVTGTAFIPIDSPTSSNDGGSAGVIWAVIGVAVLAAASVGYVWYRRREG
jgi:hypothetical protein